MRQIKRPMTMLCVAGLALAGLGLSGCDEPTPPAPPPPAPTAASGAGDAGGGAAEAALPEELPVVGLADLQAVIAETSERDQVLVIDFWATWCAPCVAMFPSLHEGLKAMGEDVRPVTVTLDSPGEREQMAIAFLAEHDALKDAYQLVPNSDGQLAVVEAIGEQWNDLVVPAVFVFDRDGKMAGEFFGANAQPILGRVRELMSDDEAVASAE